jgi:hypothetical protein
VLYLISRRKYLLKHSPYLLRLDCGSVEKQAVILGLTLDDLFYDDAMALRVHKSFSYEGLLDDCSDYEKAILSESLLALKTILKRNRS